jgi:hypothetical protein
VLVVGGALGGFPRAELLISIDDVVHKETELTNDIGVNRPAEPVNTL